MKYIYALVVIFFVFGCSSGKIKVDAKNSVEKENVVEELSDLKLVPQDVCIYTHEINATALDTIENFEKRYFKPWNVETFKLPIEEAKWAYKAFVFGKSYGENLQLLPQNYFDEILENSNFELYATENKQAVSLKLLDIRAFPTDRPLLLDPSKAGEGFPFDYMQNSTIAPNKPLLVSHYSKDGEWAFVKSSFAYGWVKKRDLMLLEKEYTDIWQKAKQIFITQDGESIYDENGIFLFKSRVGMVLPLIEENNDSYTVLSIGTYKNGIPMYMKSKISKTISHEGALEFNSENINKIINEVSKTNYGWGGMYNQRDCSSTIRDFYTAFGIWLPRNSNQQSKIGNKISLENMSDAQKIETIKANGIPFRTLLYKQGHIVMYVGEYNGDIIVYHNTWAIKTKKDGVEGRFIVGKPIFSTLRVGENLKFHNPEALLIKQLKSMSTL